MTWEDIWNRVECLNDHYALDRSRLEFVVSYALQLPIGATILELGVCNGRTLLALGMAAKAVSGIAYGMDHFRLEGSAEEVRNRLRDFNVDVTTKVIECNTHDYPWRTPLDLLVVDAGHDEANVKSDIEDYVPWVKPGGYVFFDDYDSVPCTPEESPNWAVRHYADLACGAWGDLGVVSCMRGWRRP